MSFNTGSSRGRRNTAPTLNTNGYGLFPFSPASSRRKDSVPQVFTGKSSKNPTVEIPELELSDDAIKKMSLCGNRASKTFLTARKEIEIQRMKEKQELQKAFVNLAGTSLKVNKFKRRLMKSWMESKNKPVIADITEEESNEKETSDDSDPEDEIARLHSVPNCSEEMRKNLYKKYLESPSKKWAKRLHNYDSFKYIFEQDRIFSKDLTTSRDNLTKGRTSTAQPLVRRSLSEQNQGRWEKRSEDLFRPLTAF